MPAGTNPKPQFRRRRNAARALCLSAVLALFGCQSNQPPAKPPAQTAINKNFAEDAGASQQTFSPDDILGGDPSAARLHDIEGDLLLYYRLKGEMPARLEDLKTIFGPGSQPNLTAPSGQPYMYVSGGLWMPKQDKCIVVFDPMLSSDGKRWCLVMPPPKPTAALSIDVVAIPEPLFKSYRPAGR